jgi:ribosomal protein L11 methyltransferase
MDIWEAKVEIPASSAEATDLALLESGFEGWSLLEDAVAKRAWIVGIFQGEAEAHARWMELAPTLPATPSGKFTPRRLPDADWKHSYREHFKAWTFGRLHWVPVWERGTFVLLAGHSVLWLDPGMAFGTGNHETTRLCIERLVAFEAGLAGGPTAAGRLRVIDAGCGSGILALSAFLLGFRDISGFDNDPEAIRVSLENAALNGIPSAVRFKTEPLPEGLGAGNAGVVLANIQADILIRNAAALVAAVAPGGLLAMSGILSAEIGTVRDAFAAVAPGWSANSRVLGEWCDLGLVRPAR